MVDQLREGAATCRTSPISLCHHRRRRVRRRSTRPRRRRNTHSSRSTRTTNSSLSIRQQPQYPQQPQYGVYQPQGAYPYGASSRTSGLAIASLVLGILWLYWIGSILAVIFGHIAINQAKKDPALRGKGMAIAGLVLGYIGIGLLVVTIMVAAASSPS